MSQFQQPGGYPPQPPQNPDPWNRNPWESQEPHKRKSSTAVVIAVLAVIGFCVLAVIGVAAFFLYAVWDDIDGGGFSGGSFLGDSRPPNDETRPEIRDAFTQRRIDIPEKDLQAIQTVLEDAMSIDDSPESIAKLDRTFDYLKMRDAIEESYHANLIEGGLTHDWLRSTDHAPSMYDFVQIAHVERLADDRLLVYGHVNNPGRYYTDARFWLSAFGTGGGWRLYDWEELDEGLRFSDHLAILAYHVNESQYREYNRFFAGRNDVRRKWDENTYEELAKELESLEKIEFGSLLDPYRKYWLAADYYNVGEYEKCIEWCNRIQSDRICPGKLFLLGISHFQLERLDEAESALRAYGELLGETPTSLEALANVADYRENYDQLVHLNKRLAEMVPDSSEFVFSFASSLPPDQIEQHLDSILNNSQTRDEIIENLIRGYHYNENSMFAWPVLNEMLGNDQRWRNLINAEIFRQQNDYRNAVAEYKEAVAKQSDDETKSWIRWRAIDLLIEQGELIEAYKLCDDKEEGYAEIMGEIEYNYYELPSSSIDELTTRHLRFFPNDREAQRKDAERLMRLGKDDQAIEQFQKVATDQEVDEYHRDECWNQIALIEMRRGRIDEAIAVSDSPVDRFVHICDLANAWNEPELLKSIIDEFARNHSDSPWVRYYQAMHLEQLGEYVEALTVFDQLRQEMPSYEDFEDDTNVPSREACYRHWARQLVLAHASGVNQDAELMIEDFENLEYEFSVTDDIAEVEALLSLVPSDQRDGSSYRELESTVLWDDKKYEAIVTIYETTKSDWTEEYDYSKRNWLEIVFKSYIKLGRLDEARQIADAFQEHFESGSLLFALAAVQGRTDELLKMIEDEDAAPYSFQSVLEDGDYEVDDDQFAEVRDKLPRYLYQYQSSEDLFILVEEPFDFASGEWYQALESAFPEGAIFSALASAPKYPDVHGVCVRWEDQQVLLTATNLQMKFSDGALTNEERELLDRHTAVIGIHLPSSNYAEPYSIAEPSFHELCKNLFELDFEPLAAYIAFHERFMPMSVANEWIQNPSIGLNELPDGRYTSFQIAQTGKGGSYKKPSLTKDLMDKVIKRDAGSDPRIQVMLKIRSDYLEESVWFDVVGLKRTSSSGFRVEGRRASESLLLAPDTDPDRVVQFSFSDIYDIREAPGE